ncbi:MAG: hypothetical protein ACRC9H_11185, partial [Aeromonas veronii]
AKAPLLLGVLMYWYESELKSIALAAVREAHELDGDAHDIAREMIGNHEWVIYTYKASKVLEASDSVDEAYSELRHIMSENYDEFIVSMAYYCMTMDIYPMVENYLSICPED